MKRYAFIILAGCKVNPKSIISLPSGPDYVGSYLHDTDVRHIAHALNSLPTRHTVQWENRTTGYQYSMMVFESDKSMGLITRQFTVLAINRDSDGEVLNLVGRSSGKNTWEIVADGPAAPVGKVTRMELPDTSVPAASISSGDFYGFAIITNG